MKPILLLLWSAALASASFGPNVRVDHQYQSQYECGYCAIAVGQGAPSHQPVYIAFEGDTTGRCDVWFQKSTDAGRTWLPEDMLIRRGDRYAADPDITTDADGNVYVEYIDEYIDTTGGRHYHISCQRSSDGGTTWTAPARVDDSLDRVIGSARIAADPAGNLLCVWNGRHIWSSASTDRGATWGQVVQVDDDTTNRGCYQPDVFIQPGTNQYLVVAEVPHWYDSTPHIGMCAYLYRSFDRGLTFQPGVQLDTFDYYASSPHVVAERDHIICDYTGAGESLYGHQDLTEFRTFCSGPDTWGSPVAIRPSCDDAKLALSGDGRVHTALTMYTMGPNKTYVYYASSSNHGASWSDPELVNEDTLSTGFPDIGADSAGYADVVWAQGPNSGGQFRIWFATNNPLAIAEESRRPSSARPIATVIRGVLFQPEASGLKPQVTSLLDVSGRKVIDLRPGANDVRALAPGVYFVRAEPSAASRQPSAVTKVVITR